MKEVEKILDKCLGYNEKYLSSLILSYIRCKCYICDEMCWVDDTIEVFHDKYSDCDCVGKYRCDSCSAKYFWMCIDACPECDSLI